MADRRYAGVEDLVLLTDVSERGIGKNLEKRFSSDEIYTNLGNVLIVCNPFKWLPLYDNNFIKMFNGGQLSELQPHIYAVAESAFKEMLLEDLNQCVIISGESGAGKTEAAKQIMNYIAAVSGSGGNDAQVNKVKNIILDSNPALEAFGNAMTLRNNNSSRFGKYFEIKFSASGTPMGGKITNFLLERGRLVTLGQGERSFHIFYQLVTSNNRFKQNLYLSGNPNDYNLLRMSGVIQVRNEGGSRNDAKDLEETTDSLETVGILEKGQYNLYTICAAVLHLSNVSFIDQKVGSTDGSALASQQAQNGLQSAAAVLQIDANQLHQYLTYRTLVTIAPGKGVETLQVPQNAMQASATRDSLAKDLYARMFDLLVNKINQSLKQGGEKTRASVRQQLRQSVMRDEGHSLSIGVLDIYGFEIFKQNYFEQFCINYVNEKLQQVFIELTIRAEQEDYQAEGIAWNKIPFFDNKIVCELIEGSVKTAGAKKKPKFGKGASRNIGLFQILDDTAKTITAMDGAVADRRFQDTMFGVHGSHPQLKQSARGFTVIHYAGDVIYNVGGFVDANRDTLSKDLRLLLKSSGNKFVQLLYPETVDYNDKTMPPSSGSKIKEQANVLIDTLKQCEPHYVRCIKSNSRKAPKIFEHEMVNHQVRYLNLLENVKIRRAGYAYRVKFIDFNKKFKVMGMGVVDENFYARSNPMQITTTFMQVAAQRVPQLMTPGEVQMGNTKLFIKTPEVLFELQKARRQLLGDVATKIQRFYRFCKGQKKLFTMKSYMIELFEANGKPTSPVDVLGNYQAYYIDDPITKNPIMEILEFYKEQSVVQEKVLYVDRVKRIGKTEYNRPEDAFFVITDVAFYIMRQEAEMAIQKKRLDFFKKKRKTTAVVKVDEMGNIQQRLVLKKRIELSQIKELSMTQMPDDLLRIACHVEQQKPENREGWPDSKTVKRCMQSQEPFSFFGKSKNRCHFTGGIYIKELMSTAAVPDRGFYEPVPVLASLANKVRTEMQEDVIIESERKGEICAVFMEAITKLADRNNPMRGPFAAPVAVEFDPRSCRMQPTFSNAWNIGGAEPLGFTWNSQLYCQMAPGIQGLSFTMNPDGSFTANVPSDGVSAERQQRLKAFLYKREERKRAEVRAKQALRQEARANQLRYEQEDKALRARQRAEKKARRANGGQPLPAQNQPNNANRNPFTGMNTAFGAGAPTATGNNNFKRQGLPPLPEKNTNISRNNSNQERPALPSFSSKPNFSGSRRNVGADNKKPSFGGNQFGGSVKKPSFGGNQFGGSVKKPSFGGNQTSGLSKQPSFSGSKKPSFGGNQFSGVSKQPSFGGNKKPSFGGNQFGGNKKPSFGGNQFGGNNSAVGPTNGNNPSFGGNKKPSFAANQLAGVLKKAPSFSGNKKPSFGGNQFGGSVKKPSFGGNQFGGSVKKAPSFGTGNTTQPSFGGAQSTMPTFGQKPNFGEQKPLNPFGNSASGGPSLNNQPPAPRSRFQGPDWQRVLDPNTNRYYFFNFKTQESVWDES